MRKYINLEVRGMSVKEMFEALKKISDNMEKEKCDGLVVQSVSTDGKSIIVDFL